MDRYRGMVLLFDGVDRGLVVQELELHFAKRAQGQV